MFKCSDQKVLENKDVWGRGDAPSIHMLIELLHLFAGSLFRGTAVHCDIGLCENTQAGCLLLDPQCRAS